MLNNRTDIKYSPCRQKIYDLRGVTSTITSAPLIASSIMSKKLASGLV